MPQNPITGQTDVMDPVARVLLQNAMRERPMYHWAEPLGRLAQFGVGAFVEEGRRKGEESEMKDWLSAMPGLGTPGASPAAATPGPTGPRPPSAEAAAPAPSTPAGPSRDIASASQPGVPAAPAIPRAAVPAAGRGDVQALALEAAQKTGVDPAYLTKLVGAESGANPAATSDQGAAGLGQFMPGTWKTYIAKYGPLYGYGPETPPSDARANMLMTAHYTKDSIEDFRRRQGRDPAPAELYAMHFLGTEGAQRLFGNPGATMDQLFPELTSKTLPNGQPNPRYSPTNIAAMTSGGRFLTGTEMLQRLGGKVGGPAPSPGGQQVAQAPAAPAAPGATPSVTDVTRQPGAIPPEVAAHIRKGLESRNPRVRAAAMGLYQQYATPDKPTDEARNYALYARQEQAAGRPVMSFFEWDIKRRSAATNQFSVNTPPAEKAADVESAKLAAGRLKDLGEAADTANKMVPAVIRIGGLLDRVQTGKFLPQKITIGQYAKSLGIDVGAMGLSGEDLVNAETLRSLMIAQVTSIAKTLGANPTNYDAQLLAQQVANLENTPEGNRQIMKTTRDAIDFARRYETAAANYFKQHRHLHGFAEEFGIKEDERRRKAGLPTFSEPEAAPTAPTAPATRPAPRTAAPPPPDAQGRRWAEDALGRRYYTPDGGKTWFNSDGTPLQLPKTR